MTAEQLDFWVATDEFSPIGNSGLVELLAVIGAAMLSTEEKPLTPNDIKQACIVHGANWKPLDPRDTEKPITGEQLAIMMMAAR